MWPISKSKLKILAWFGIAIMIVTGTSVPVATAETINSDEPAYDYLNLDLDTCIEIALKNNQQRRISQYAIEVAEAQYKQAQSGYWPQLSLSMAATRMDQDQNYIFPEEESTYTISGLAPVPTDVQVTVPEKDIKLMDRDTLTTTLNLTVPLFTGGKVSSLAKQGKIGVEAARTAARRTDLTVILDTKRMYHGAVLATALYEIIKDTVSQLEFTLELTEKLYQNGSGSVKKTDYLRTKVMVASSQSMLALMASNKALAHAALVNTMGLEWTTQIKLNSEQIPFKPYENELAELVVQAYTHNPDWYSLELGLEAADAGITGARAGYYPVIAFIGSAHHIENEYDKGYMTPDNKDGWTIGIGMELPLFQGFRNQSKVREAKLRMKKLERQKILLKEGIALQVKDAFLQIQRAHDQVLALQTSLEAASQNRSLNIRAYQNELVETRDVIEAQLFESYINGQFLKARHDHTVQQAKLEFIIGDQVEGALN